MTDPTQTAGPGDSAGPAGEHIVGDERTSESAQQAEATMEGSTTPAADSAPVADSDADVVTGEIVSDNGQPASAQPAAAGQTSAAAQAGAAQAGAQSPAQPAADGTPLGAELEALRTEVDERIRDLQRVTAEYANYRRRVERDRAAVVEQATGLVLSALLPVLDDLDRAREHGDLTGPQAVMAEQLHAAMAKFGLTGFGDVGDAFDPTRHEAVAHQTSADVTEPTCVGVMRRGYLLGERLLRPALVAVADPE